MSPRRALRPRPNGRRRPGRTRRTLRKPKPPPPRRSAVWRWPSMRGHGGRGPRPDLLRVHARPPLMRVQKARSCSSRSPAHRHGDVMSLLRCVDRSSQTYRISYRELSKYASRYIVICNVMSSSDPEARALPRRAEARGDASGGSGDGGRDHRHPRGVRGGDDLLVAHRPAGLDDRPDAGVDRELRAVGEGEEGVGGQRRAGEQLRLGGAGLLDRRSAPRRRGSSDPAPIPIVAPPRAITIALERTWRQTFQANSRSSHCCLARLARSRHHAHLLARLGDDVARLHELAADHRLAFDLVARRRPVGAAPAGARFSSPAAARARPASKPGASSTSMNCSDSSLGAGPIDAPVERDHAAVGALRVAREGAFVGRLASRRARSRRGCCA